MWMEGRLPTTHHHNEHNCCKVLVVIFIQQELLLLIHKKGVLGWCAAPWKCTCPEGKVNPLATYACSSQLCSHTPYFIRTRWCSGRAHSILGPHNPRNTTGSDVKHRDHSVANTCRYDWNFEKEMGCIWGSVCSYYGLWTIFTVDI